MIARCPRPPVLLIASVFAVLLFAMPASAQTTNQLFMTGTGSGNTPIIYTNGVDTNINMGLMPKGTGGVGIGATNPSALLQVGNGGATGKLVVDSQDNSYGQIQILNSSTTGQANIGFYNGASTGSDGFSGGYGWAIGLGPYNIGSSFGISSGVLGGVALTVTTSGSVGIGTTAPSTLLDVNGTMRLEPQSVSLTADNTLVTVSSSYLQVTSNNGTATNRTMCLTAGAAAGQILFIEDMSTNKFEIQEAAAASQPCGGASAGTNFSGGTQSFTSVNAILELIWDGSLWISVSPINEN